MLLSWRTHTRFFPFGVVATKARVVPSGVEDERGPLRRQDRGPDRVQRLSARRKPGNQRRCQGKSHECDKSPGNALSALSGRYNHGVSARLGAFLRDPPQLKLDVVRCLESVVGILGKTRLPESV